jgi:hypothetical protein
VIARAIVVISALLAAAASQSPFNSYEVFLDAHKIPGSCVAGDLEGFRNRTYTFRNGSVYPFGAPLALSDGRLIEQNPLGTPEWETSLLSAEWVTVERRQAALITIGANHVHGSGGVTHVLVAECRDRQLFVLFEASGEGVRDVAFTKNRGLTVRCWVWESNDAHCCPSKQAEERFHWRGGRFVRVSRVLRRAQR